MVEGDVSLKKAKSTHALKIDSVRHKLKTGSKGQGQGGHLRGGVSQTQLNLLKMPKKKKSKKAN